MRWYFVPANEIVSGRGRGWGIRMVLLFRPLVLPVVKFWGFPRICRQTDNRRSNWLDYGSLQAWLTFVHASLNFHHSLASDLSSCFRAEETIAEFSANSVDKFILGLYGPGKDLVAIYWIPAVSWPLICHIRNYVYIRFSANPVTPYANL